MIILTEKELKEAIDEFLKGESKGPYLYEAIIAQNLRSRFSKRFTSCSKLYEFLKTEMLM